MSKTNKQFTNIHPTMYRALSSLYEDEKEFNDKIINTGIVPPSQFLSGYREEMMLMGSAWSLNHEYVTKQLYDPHEIHSVLRKQVNIQCKDGKIDILEPSCCKIEEGEAEGVMIVCTCPIKFDSAEVTGNPVVFKGKRRFI